MMAEGGNSGAMAAIPGLVDSEIVNVRVSAVLLPVSMRAQHFSSGSMRI